MNNKLVLFLLLIFLILLLLFLYLNIKSNIIILLGVIIILLINDLIVNKEHFYGDTKPTCSDTNTSETNNLDDLLYRVNNTLDKLKKLDDEAPSDRDDAKYLSVKSSCE